MDKEWALEEERPTKLASVVGPAMYGLCALERLLNHSDLQFCLLKKGIITYFWIVVM